MAIHTRKQGATVIFDLDGKLTLGDDVDNFRAKWSEAVDAGAHDIIIDMQKVRMVDSSGIGTLIRCHSAVSAAGGKLRLVSPNEAVRQAFKVTRLDTVFEFNDTVEAALAVTNEKT